MSTMTIADELRLIRETLDESMLRDRYRARKKIRSIEKRMRDGRPVDRMLHSLQTRLSASAAQRRARAQTMPELHYRDDLPVAEKRDEIAAAIARHQVVIVSGETGSGKTTQLAKICLGIGRGVDGVIGHTQPRRIAARSVARRIAEELGEETGASVGYKIRFNDYTHEATRIKLMTDGILLAEIRNDRDLSEYDTLIIDEAHERNLNIDFILGYLKGLLARRPELKVIITSATIAHDRFSRHFDNAPVIRVSGRGYPVEVRYRPLADAADSDLHDGIVAAVDELAAEGRGDILVFLSSEREIRECAEMLRKHHPRDSEILPLYSRLGQAQQNRIFRPGRRRRIILATNVAETSLTVPGIHYVIDSGYARISQYSYRRKVQRLPVERISRSSADQRAGRCGRIAPGVCIRLYAEEDYQSRPEFTAPEILRSNLSNVILQMEALGIGPIETFPFIDAPDQRYVNDGYMLLRELGALDADNRITAQGREMQRYPLDVRLSRMLVAAAREDCLDELITVTAALSVQDPRERPAGEEKKADQCHAAWADERSDFSAWLHLWRHLDELYHTVSKNKLRRYCREHYLSYARVIEWRDIRQQILALVKEAGRQDNRSAADYQQIHRAILSGLLTNVAQRLERSEYQGVRGRRLRVFPGSGLYPKSPKWIVAFEMVETSRHYARTVAGIDPLWIEALGGELLQREYFSPHWDRKRAQVVAYEKSSLYGLVITAKRQVNYARHDPHTARQIFIAEALVEMEFDSDHDVIRHNRDVVKRLHDIEQKSRSTVISFCDADLQQFFQERLPAEVCDGASFNRLARTDPQALQQLRLDGALYADRFMEPGFDERYPDEITIDGTRLTLDYHYSPASSSDGVTVNVPAICLPVIDAAPLSWLVPGYLEDKVRALLKALPKEIRRKLGPLREVAAAFIAAHPDHDGDLAAILGDHVSRVTGVDREVIEFPAAALPAYLKAKYRVITDNGKVAAYSDDLQQIRRELASGSADGVIALDHPLCRDGLSRWDFEMLPEHVTVAQGGARLVVYPALQQRGDSVAIVLYGNAAAAAAAMRDGVRRLFMLMHRSAVRALEQTIAAHQLCLLYASLGQCAQLREQLVTVALDDLLYEDGCVPRGRAEYDRAAAHTVANLAAHGTTLVTIVERVLRSYHQASAAVAALPRGELRDDLEAQLARLVPPDFVALTPRRWLAHVPRYLDAAAQRASRTATARDREHLARLRELDARYQALDEQARADEKLCNFPWLLEELRVSLFAQSLQTVQPVSFVRLERMLQGRR